MFGAVKEPPAPIVMFGADTSPVKAAPIKLAFSLNVCVNEVPFKVIAGVINVTNALTVMFGADTVRATVVSHKNLCVFPN